MIIVTVDLFLFVYLFVFHKIIYTKYVQNTRVCFKSKIMKRKKLNYFVIIILFKFNNINNNNDKVNQVDVQKNKSWAIYFLPKPRVYLAIGKGAQTKIANYKCLITVSKQ